MINKESRIDVNMAVRLFKSYQLISVCYENKTVFNVGSLEYCRSKVPPEFIPIGKNHTSMSFSEMYGSKDSGRIEIVYATVDTEESELKELNMSEAVDMIYHSGIDVSSFKYITADRFCIELHKELPDKNLEGGCWSSPCRDKLFVSYWEGGDNWENLIFTLSDIL